MAPGDGQLERAPWRGGIETQPAAPQSDHCSGPCPSGGIASPRVHVPSRSAGGRGAGVNRPRGTPPTSPTPRPEPMNVRRCLEIWGDPNAVKLAPGIPNPGPRPQESSVHRCAAEIEVNLNGTWRTIRAALPAMIEAGNGGSIIMVSSATGINPLQATARYSCPLRRQARTGRADHRRTALTSVLLPTLSESE